MQKLRDFRQLIDELILTAAAICGAISMLAVILFLTISGIIALLNLLLR
ncbi:hypothetical protein [Nonomuraea lactucae]|nr:hypothetical protein [Nonomuraea lactucae]